MKTFIVVCLSLHVHVYLRYHEKRDHVTVFHHFHRLTYLFEALLKW